MICHRQNTLLKANCLPGKVLSEILLGCGKILWMDIKITGINKFIINGA
jgi:hypothetical protein